MLRTFLQSLSFIPFMASEEIFEYFLPWQPIKFRDLDTIRMVGRGSFKEHFCKTSVKISAIR